MREKSIDAKRDCLEKIRIYRDYWKGFSVRIIVWMEAFDKCSYLEISLGLVD